MYRPGHLTIAGYHPLDTNSLAATVPDYANALRQKVSTLRLGIPRATFYDKLDPEIERAVNEALQVLRRLTASSRTSNCRGAASVSAWSRHRFFAFFGSSWLRTWRSTQYDAVYGPWAL
jgi:Asp-tRNA(Asn)/Glu-tRNA(Gln) amidotransferase A subunit family amidase